MKPRFNFRNDIKIMFFVVTLLTILTYLYVMYNYISVLPSHQFMLKQNNSRIQKTLVLPYVVVHIDLKKMPPKLAYLESILPLLKNNGANGLLMEYEDMFPFKGKLVNLSRKDCYKKSELQEFLSQAVGLGFEIIPLIQTFGHMEYALKLQEYQHLREVPIYPDSICPNKPGSHALIKEMLKQVIYFHNRIFPIKYIHVGCDEVFHINKCLSCQRTNYSKEDIFVKHVDMVTYTVKTFSPSTTVLIWDDMLRKIEYKTWNKTYYFSDVNPVCWDYREKVAVAHYDLIRYHKKFKHIWIASAFKGADGRSATFPNIKTRFMNHVSWLNTITGYIFGGEREVYNFKGIILTGWSSYSHMDPPCELLPVSIHNLILNLYVINKYKAGENVNEISEQDPGKLFDMFFDVKLRMSLQCQFSMPLENFDISFCKFNGSKLYKLLDDYISIADDIITKFYDDREGEYAIEYYARKHKMINKNTITDNVSFLNNTINVLSHIENVITNVMKLYYTDEIVEEYVNFKTYYVKKIWKEFMLSISPIISNQ